MPFGPPENVHREKFTLFCYGRRTREHTEARFAIRAVVGTITATHRHTAIVTRDEQENGEWRSKLFGFLLSPFSCFF
jgi:hypothetical protein